MFNNTKQRIVTLEQARTEQQNDINKLRQIGNDRQAAFESLAKRVFDLEKEIADRLADMRQRIEDIALAYADDPRRKEAEPKPEEQTPIIKGVTPFSMRRRAFEAKHSNPKRVAEKMLAPKETAVKEPS